MSESITITLTGAAAEKLETLVARGDYASAEEAVTDALFQLSEEIEDLGREWTAEIRRRIAAHEADPGSAIPVEELRARLAARFAAKR